MRRCFALTLMLVFVALPTRSDDRVDERTLRAAISRSLPLLEAAARGSAEKRGQCFTCHNQCLPVMALTNARSRGFPVDEGNLAKQLDLTVTFLAKNKDHYPKGRGQGGQALTAGYALLTLELGGRDRDDVTDAVVEYLLRWQKDLGHWKPLNERPPTEESPFTTTYLSVRALRRFARDQHQGRAAERISGARTWLEATPADSTEDLVFRLRALNVAEAPKNQLRRARQDLLDAQQPDGGWRQLPDMATDAYATASALVSLHEAAELPTTHPAYQKGLNWLLRAQLPDGSWHVKTRSDPIQTYFESGYPHGRDQFISVTAAGWATTALLQALSPTP